jgi:hypothetical protein
MKKIILYLLPVLLIAVLSGCIRLAGSAGYYKQGTEDKEPVSKSVGFDTQDLIDPDRPKGNITV